MVENNLQQKKNKLKELDKTLVDVVVSSNERGEKLNEMEKQLRDIGVKISEIKKQDISDKEFNDFVDNNKVSEERLKEIAEKYKNKENLSDKEKAIFQNKIPEIEKVLKNEITETKTEESSEQNTNKEELETFKNFAEGRLKKIEDAEKLQAKISEIEATNKTKDPFEIAKNNVNAFINQRIEEIKKQEKKKGDQRDIENKKEFELQLEKLGTPENKEKEEVNLDKKLTEIKLKRKNELENGPMSARLKNGVIKGLEKWENYGKNEKGELEKGWNGFRKRFTKTAINLALIGLISSFSVQKLAEVGVGTATALSGGITSYLSKKLLIGLSLGGVMDAGGKIIPEKAKKTIQKLMPWILGGGSILFASIATGGFAGVAAGISFGAGLAASKLVKGKFSEEQINKKEEEARKNLLKIYEGKGKVIDENNLKKIEEEYLRLIKKYENQRVWGKLLDGAKKLGTGALVSTVSLEASGFAKDFSQHQNQNIEKTETKIHKENHDTSIKNTANTTTKDAANIKNNISAKDTTNIKNIPIKTNSVNNQVNQTPANTQAETKHDAEQIQFAVVHKGEGIENSFIRQIENDHSLAKELGYKGDLNDVKSLHEFAGREAHVIAIKEGYVDNNGNEIRVGEADKIAYEIKTEGGHITVDEKSISGEIIGTHHEGDKFGENINKNEYLKNNDSINHSNHPATATQDSHTIIPPKPIHLENNLNNDNHNNSENIISPKPINQENDSNLNNQETHTIIPPKPIHPENNLNNNHTGSNQTSSKNENTNSNHDLNPELSTKVDEFYDHIINKIFPKENMFAWDNIKKSTDLTAEKMLTIDSSDKLPVYQHIIDYMKKIHLEIKLEPKGETLTTSAETNAEYIKRVLQKAAEMGQLDKVDYNN